MERFRGGFLMRRKNAGAFSEWDAAPFVVPVPEKEKRRRLLCASCGHPITDTAQAVKINGSHQHVFWNPAGVRFEIACYDAAPGCAKQGGYTSRFTWFQGFSWNYAFCGACRTHLGWHYRHPEQEPFYGLISACLREESTN